MISTSLAAFVIVGYFMILLLISYFTSRNADTLSFFTAHKQSPWYLVAFGMIGTSLSGVTFISVPGQVVSAGFSYYQVVLGYILGYLVIGLVLMPLYYRLNLVSIYTYLGQRLGPISYKTGAFFFLLSRTLGSAMRLYLASAVLHLFLFGPMHIPFAVTAMVTLALIWLYTYKGGIKTIVWTDTFQTFFLVSSVIICTVVIVGKLNMNSVDLWRSMKETGFSTMFRFEDILAKNHFLKHFFGGAFIAIAMTGLDQDLMQKNLTCRNIGDAQKNMFSFTTLLVVVNLLFLVLGALLYLYAAKFQVMLPTGTDGKVITDNVFPYLAMNEFGTLAGIFFLLGITASSFASADSALAALTTSFCIDFLPWKTYNERTKNRNKNWVHLVFCVVFFAIILIAREVADRALIDLILSLAGYTYGPLWGLFAFGILTKRQVNDKAIPAICLLSPAACFLLDRNSDWLLGGYRFGFELLILNGLLTFIGILAVSRKTKISVPVPKKNYIDFT